MGSFFGPQQGSAGPMSTGLSGQEHNDFVDYFNSLHPEARTTQIDFQHALDIWGGADPTTVYQNQRWYKPPTSSPNYSPPNSPGFSSTAVLPNKSVQASPSPMQQEQAALDRRDYLQNNPLDAIRDPLGHQFSQVVGGSQSTDPLDEFYKRLAGLA